MADTFLSQVALFACDFVPRNFMPCQGQSMEITQYQALYALIGDSFGGTDTTFNLPKISPDQAPPGLTYAICVQGIFPERP